MKDFIQSLLREASTWRGIFLILSAFGGYEFTQNQQDALIYLAVAVFGGLHFVPDKLGKG